MYPNYVDFDYWDYIYAEGDTKSIQDAQALINGFGLVTARANTIVLVNGAVVGNGQLTINLYRVGEEWGVTPDESNTWTVIPSDSGGWTEQTTGNNSWQRLG